jgi:N-acetylglucosaminyldiphosphoundecaprenol N-acetyl-beta-D-mannosaminyltransferase
MNLPPSDDENGFPKIELMGLRFSAVTEMETASYVVEQAAAGLGGWVVTPNLDILRQCVQRPDLAAMVKGADLLVADGMPLVWASRIQGTPLPERVAGSNLVSLISSKAAEGGLAVFLLGGVEGAAQGAADSLCRKYPGLRVVGTYSPPFGFEDDDSELQRITQQICRSGPEVVFVGLGFPKQEKLIERLRSVHASAWWLGVGISFSFLSGGVARAPGWMQRCGLEWVHRVLQEPRRLGRRYLIHGIPFAFQLFAGVARRRYARAPHLGGG